MGFALGAPFDPTFPSTSKLSSPLFPHTSLFLTLTAPPWS